MERFDVVVVGAGPAGSVASYRLARAGARVLLLDKARFPRDKPCGGGITMRALAELPIDVEPVVEDRVDRITFGFRYRRRFQRRSAEPLFLMTQRRRLDEHLAREATRAGADFRDGVKLDLVTQSYIVVAGERIGFDALIGADGANGVTSKLLGARYEYGVAFEGNVPTAAIDCGHAFVELGTVAGGYGWIFPKADHVNVGVGGWEREGPRLREALAELCEAYGIPFAEVRELRGHRLPMRRPDSVPARGRVALVGDAAGLIDPISGDGMYEAFLSARFAAEAYLEGNLEAYGPRIVAALRRQEQAAWAVKRALDRWPRLAYAILRTPPAWRLMETVLRGDSASLDAARGRLRAPLRALEALGKT